VQTNHFPISRSLSFCRSVYRHSRPDRYVAFLRHPSQGFDATVEDGKAVVYHAVVREPEDRWRLVERKTLSPDLNPCEFPRAVNAHVEFTLCSSGFLRIRRRGKREYISPEQHCVALRQEGRSVLSLGVSALAHLRWTWDVERHRGRTWLVPLAGRCFLTATSPLESRPLHDWLLGEIHHGERIHGIDLHSGARCLLDCRHGNWVYLTRGVWKPLTGAKWRITLDMNALRRLGHSQAAYYSAQFTFKEMLATLRSCSPFGQLVETLQPLEVPADDHGQAGGRHLRFRRGSGRDLKDVLKLGILEPPPRPVRLTVVASAKSSEDDQRARQILNAHLTERKHLTGERGQKILRSVGAAKREDTIATIWTRSETYSGRGFGLDPFDVVRAIHSYDPSTGQLLAPEQLRAFADQADHEGRSLIALILLDEEVQKEIRDELLQQFRGRRALTLQPSALSAAKGYKCWVNLTLALAQKAGAVPWLLHELPGADEKTVFVGIDLGHNHRANRSRLALTLFSHEGRALDWRKMEFGQNNERIPASALTHDLPRFIFDRGRSPTQVIIHRDGRYVDGEEHDIVEALSGIARLTLVSIKKDPATRFFPSEAEGACLRLDVQRALLITNAQAKKTGMPDPIEVESVEPGDRPLGEVVAQVFWLTRLCQGSAFLPRRLPVTIGSANGIAATGIAIHWKGWDCPSPE
jgi:hypothetical protein